MRTRLEGGEPPLVSFFLGEASWYLLSTRKVMGSYGGQNGEVTALDVLADHFGNFQRYGGEELKLMKLRLDPDGSHPFFNKLEAWP